jgi:ribulose-5-phosphate 4-epimerase/fuculose-1-phosphate aldolase
VRVTIMTFASSAELRAEVLTACRVLTHFRIVEGFGHVSARIPGGDRILFTPRRALGLVTENELLELDLDGRKHAGAGSPALEVAMHLAVYRRRPDVMAIARGHPRHVAAYACSAEPLKVAHGFGANLGAVVPVFKQPFLAMGHEMGGNVAATLGNGAAVILQGNGMLAVGQSVAHACVQALFLEETAEVLLKALGAGFTPRFYTPEAATRRHENDAVHEPIRAWEYYVGAATGKFTHR